MAAPPLGALFAHIDAHEEKWVRLLREAVAIDSVSAEPARRGKCFEMMEFAKVRRDRDDACMHPPCIY